MHFIAFNLGPCIKSCAPPNNISCEKAADKTSGFSYFQKKSVEEKKKTAPEKRGKCTKFKNFDFRVRFWNKLKGGNRVRVCAQHFEIYGA